MKNEVGFTIMTVPLMHAFIDFALGDPLLLTRVIIYLLLYCISFIDISACILGENAVSTYSIFLHTCQFMHFQINCISIKFTPSMRM